MSKPGPGERHRAALRLLGAVVPLAAALLFGAIAFGAPSPLVFPLWAAAAYLAWSCFADLLVVLGLRGRIRMRRGLFLGSIGLTFVTIAYWMIWLWWTTR